MNQQEFFKRYSYDIRTDRIGGGSFGNVYKAHDNVHHEDVAVKVAEVQHFGNKEFSLKIELDTVKSMPDHPNIALYKEVYQFEMPNGIFDFAIMKYYPHGNLKNILSEHSLSQAQKESIARQLIAGVAHLHQNGVLHRDLKPANILIHQQGNNYFPLIADFGLSKLSQSEGSRISNSFGGGTLEYSAPEQLLGKTLRYNADLWALGVIVYELFTGKRPFVTDNTNSSAEAKRQEIFNKIVNAPLPKDVENLPTPFNTFVANCLEKDPEIRAKTTAEALEKIATKGQGQPFGEAQKEETEVKKPPPKPPTPEPTPTRPWFIILIIIIIYHLLFHYFAFISNNEYINNNDYIVIILLLLYFISYGFLGVLGGWLGEKLIKEHKHGLIGNIIFGILGILGAIGGVFCRDLFNIYIENELYGFIIVYIGAAFIPFISVLIRKFIITSSKKKT